ncbi:MAG: 2Fe-2S iron-sulfur cluster-binding protein, partial [Halobacteriovoraceae bacterium]|nr:2Fe-2S iron-sulfur cluster-binding protein [Halobacteriovoraceae bacterium]
CGGHASCSECVVKVVKGEENINSPTPEENRLLGSVFHITKERLSCQTKVSGNVTLDISAHQEKVDQMRMQNKNKKFRKNRPAVKVRKKEEFKKIKEERQKNEKDDSWHRHWEKDSDKEKGQRKLGGRRRPKPFRSPDDDENKN